MPRIPPSLSGPTDSDDSLTLTDRVAARVIDARLAIERRTTQTLNDAASTGEQRETESLRRVFRDMGVSTAVTAVRLVGGSCLVSGTLPTSSAQTPAWHPW
jgi:hypothetical protein